LRSEPIHYSIPVSDVAKSTQFYTDVVGCSLLSTPPNGQMVFLDAAVTCLMLMKRDPPINPVLDDHGVCITPSSSHMRGAQGRSTFCALVASRSRSRRTGKAAWSTARVPYFHDPDGTVLEFIDLTSYTGNRL
jgi:catechol 2,3-dioxygenase-like lactoylglutathione lyase family enzyme